MNSPMPPAAPPQEMGAEVDEYKPQTIASDRFNSLIDAYPTEERPSVLRRIASMIADYTEGTQAGQATLHDPFNRKVANWKNQVGPAQQAAQLERQQGIAELGIRKQDETERRNKATEDINKSKVSLAQFRQEHPDWKIDYRGPNPIAVNPQNPRESIVLDAKTGHLSDVDKLERQQTNALARIGATGTEARKTEDVRQTGRADIAETRGWMPFNLPDGTSVLINQITGEKRPLDVTGPLSKPGTKGPGNIEPAKLEAIQNKTRETLQTLNEIIDEDNNLRPDIKSVIGGSRIFGPQWLPGDLGNRQAEAKINQLKSQLIVDLIGEMKSQSKTGATGFGQLNIRELAVLETAVGRLDPAMDEKSFALALKEIKEKLNKVLQPPDGLNPTTTVKPGSLTPIGPTKLTPEQLYKKYGG